METKKIIIQDKEILLDLDVYRMLVGYLKDVGYVGRKNPIPLYISDKLRAIFYFRDGKDRKKIQLHHLVVGKPINGLVVDHINRNPLDNRRCNLRIVTQLENMQNTGPRIKPTDPYKDMKRLRRIVT